MKVSSLSKLNEQLMSHIVGGSMGEEFTCVYNRRQRRQYSAVDDSDTGEILRPIEEQPSFSVSLTAKVEP